MQQDTFIYLFNTHIYLYISLHLYITYLSTLYIVHFFSLDNFFFYFVLFNLTTWKNTIVFLNHTVVKFVVIL